MPRGGHNAKPTTLRVLQGTDRRDRMRENEPHPSGLVDLTPPASLDLYGKQCWKRNAPILANLGLLTEADADLLTVYCDAWSQWRRASIAVRKIKPGDEQYRKVAVTVEKARDQLRLMAGELGMSPASRSRLSVGKPVEDVDPMEALLKGRAS